MMILCIAEKTVYSILQGDRFRFQVEHVGNVRCFGVHQLTEIG